MEVAFWELAAYLPGLRAETLGGAKGHFVQDNAGKAFELMLEDADAARAAEGLPSAEAAHGAPLSVDAPTLHAINAARGRFGLPPLPDARAAYPSLLQMQKDETVQALRVHTQVNFGAAEMLDALAANGVPFNIATTSGKPRVPVCVNAGGLRRYFPTDARIHSGESDFAVPRFKPAPDVYLKAAEAEGLAPEQCVAVEDSASGVASAANAGVGLIVGYVGGTHIPPDRKAAHAQALLAGGRSQTGRGAQLVISDLRDLAAVVEAWRQQRRCTPPLVVPTTVGRLYVPDSASASHTLPLGWFSRV